MNDKINVYIVGEDNSYAKLFLGKIKIVSKIEEANVILFTGGEDVSPDYYGEDMGGYTSSNRDRDKKELEIFKVARSYNKLCAGICRGAQALTVFSGGNLIQHVTGHAINGTHKIHLMNEDVDIDITSTHHQMMWPFWLNKADYNILAKSMNDLSTTYLDGNDREKKIPIDFVEPEIVYYNKTNCLCIQGHPEYMPKDSSAVRYINVLIREYLEDTIETTPRIIEGDIEAPNVDDGIVGQIRNVHAELNNIHWGNLNIMANEVVAHAQRPARNAPRWQFNNNDLEFLDANLR